MRFIAHFHDSVDPAQQKPELNARHFAYLEAHASEIVLAGGLRQDAGSPFVGALWVIEAADRAEAVRLVAEDPYSQADLWPNVEILAWGKAPFYGPVTL